MALRFIIGRAGSGKTRTCLGEISSCLQEAPKGNPLIFIVPEQATFQNEMALVSTSNLEGTIRARVLSFRRLAWYVLQETGGATRPYIGDVGKHMLLRQLLEDYKEQLKAFSRSANQPGFINCLAGTFAEFKQFHMAPGELSHAAQIYSENKSEQLLAKKLADLSLLYQAYETSLAGKYIDPEDCLTLLAERLGGSQTVHGAEVWMDGFSGFTPQELRVIESLLLSCRQVNVALCLDSLLLELVPEEDDVFFPVWDTYQKVLSLARQNGIDVLPSLVLSEKVLPRFAAQPVLGHLERHLFFHPTAVWTGDTTPVTMVAAANKRAEVEGAARKILELCREEGYRWREISVVVRDLSSYGDLIASIFCDFDIPCFIDVKRSVLHHPLIELIRSALEVVVENWAYDPMFRFFKTDLIPVSRDEIDLLENYVLAHGISGSRWYDGKPWNYRRRYTLGEDAELTRWEEEELYRINTIRDRACLPLKAFYQRVKKADQVNNLCTAIFELLEDLKVPEQLEIWEREAEAAGQLDWAMECRQVWDTVMDMLDQMVESLGERFISTVDFLKILDAGCAGIRLGLIPPGLDQVFVASLDRSRNPDVKACFVLGVNEGVLPTRVLDGGIFTPRDRDVLEQGHWAMAPGGKRQVFDEQFLIYIALTRASSRLWISYALADEEGKSLLPSLVVKRVKELMPDLTEITCSAEPPGGEGDLVFVTGVRHALSYLGIQLRESRRSEPVSPLWWDVYNYLVRHPELKREMEIVTGGLFFSNQEKNIPANLAANLYGNKLVTSVSRLEKFRACPFAHFVSFGLGLKERAEYRLGAPDLGQFFHAALQMAADQLACVGRDWSELTDAECASLAHQAVEELVPKLQNEILLSTARYRHLTGKLAATVSTALRVLAEHTRRGEFRPVQWEIAFGPEGPLSSLKLDLGNGREMELVGRIDRIDVASAGDNYYLRVVDYKSGRSKLDLVDLFYGLKLQLLVYLQVALGNVAILGEDEAFPAAILYFPVQNPLVPASGPLAQEEAKEEIIKSFKMQGLVLADPGVVRMMDKTIDGYSHILPVGLSAKGTFYERAPGVSEVQFALLRQHLMRLLRETARHILDGLVTISPYKKGDFTSCHHCSFKAVCKFDPLLEENRYRPILSEKPERIWSKLAAGGKEDGHE